MKSLACLCQSHGFSCLVHHKVSMLTRAAPPCLLPPTRHFPGELEKILVWFRDYKTPDGKPQNKFGYDNKCMNKEFTMHVVQETHEAYINLKSGKRANTEELSLI